MKKINYKKKILIYSGIGMLVIASTSPLLLSTFNNTNSTYLQKEAQEKAKEDASSINNIGIILTSCLTIITLSIFVTWLVIFIKKQTSSKTKTFKYK